MSAIDPQKQAIFLELLKRKDSMPPEKQALVDELGKRLGLIVTPKESIRNVQAASTVKPLIPRTAADWLRSANDFGSGIAETLNPLPAIKALATHPLDTLGGVLSAQIWQFPKAAEDFQQGHYSEAVGHAMAGALPLVGPAAANTGETIGRGEVARGLGQATALVAPAVVHMAGEAIAGKQVLPSMITKNPVEAEAVRRGLDEGLPVDAATATGNPAVRGTQWLSDRSIGGSIANRGQAANAAELMAQRLEELAAGPSGGPSITPEQAGASLQTSLEKTIQAHAADADAAYSKLRSIEADPKMMQTIQTGTKAATPTLADIGAPDYGSGKPATVPIKEQIPMAADTRAAKAALTPILEQVKRQMPVAQQRASAGLKAIENIVNGPDFAPASQVDGDLSAIKAIARTSGDSGLRNVSQGLAAKAVKELSRAVDDAVAQGGPDAVDALRAGRQATIAKYAVNDVLDKLRDEPVQAFNQTTWAKDAGIEQLRDLAKHAPAEMPKIGSAFLNDILDTSTAEGGFDRAQGAAAKWQKLGPETKAILFKNPAYISDLDNFFTLAKKLSENPNPSGSGYTAALTAQLYGAAASPLTSALTQAGGYALSKMLHSPSVVRALVEGLKVSPTVGRTAAGSLALMKALNIVKQYATDDSADSPSTRSGQLIAAPAR